MSEPKKKVGFVDIRMQMWLNGYEWRFKLGAQFRESVGGNLVDSELIFDPLEDRLDDLVSQTVRVARDLSEAQRGKR